MFSKRCGTRIVAVLVCCAVHLEGRSVQAQTDDRATRIAAESLSEAGVKMYKAGLFEQANDTLAKAYLIRPLPSIGLWQARVLAKLNHQVDAFERLRDVTHLTLTAGDPASEKKAQVDASAEMMTLSRQLPVLTIQVKGTVGSDVTLSLDGKPLDRSLIGQPHRVNPGSHHIEAVRLSDRVSSQSDVEVKIGERSTVVLQFVGNASGSGQLLTPEPNSTQAASPGINAGQPLTPSSAAMPLSSNPVLATSGSGQTPPVHAAPKTLGNSATASLLATNAQPSTQATGQRHATVRPLAMTGGLLPVTIEPDPRQMAPALEATSKRSTANSLVGYGSLGTGIASLVVGVGAYALALGEKSALNSSPNCSDTRCNSLERSNVDSYNQLRTTAIIGLLGGAALATTGIVTLFYPRMEKRERKVALDVGPMSAVVRGEF